MTPVILWAVSALALDILILRWAFNEEHYGWDAFKSLFRVPCMVLIFLIPIGAFLWLIERGVIQ